jgi:hypothetical protein
VSLSAAAVQAVKALRAKQAAKELHAEPGTYEGKNFVFPDEAGNPPDLYGLSKAFARLGRSRKSRGRPCIRADISPLRQPSSKEAI